MSRLNPPSTHARGAMPPKGIEIISAAFTNMSDGIHPSRRDRAHRKRGLSILKDDSKGIENNHLPELGPAQDRMRTLTVGLACDLN